jgi:hypothetical protein
MLLRRSLKIHLIVSPYFYSISHEIIKPCQPESQREENMEKSLMQLMVNIQWSEKQEPLNINHCDLAVVSYHRS